MKLSNKVVSLLIVGILVIVGVSGTYFYISFNSFLSNPEIDQSLYSEGYSKLVSFLILYFVALIILGGFAIYLFNRMVFKPLFKTANQINEINISDICVNYDLSELKTNLDRYDEISSLKNAINQMVVKINTENKKVKRSEDLFRTIFEQAPMGIALSDSKSFKMKNLNKSFRKILKIDGEDINEKTDLEIDWRKITHPDDLDEDAATMQRLVKGEINNYKMYKRYVLDDEEIVWVSMRVARLESDDPDYPLAICMVNDITSYKKKEEEIYNLTYKDVLTGLYNRTYFEEEKKNISENDSYPLSIIMCDVNGLKMMNDGFGHHYGDNLLKRAADVLMEVCGSDSLIFRIGGDEFCVLLPKTTNQKARSLVSQIKNKCKSYAPNNNQDVFYLSLAIGVKTTSNPQMEIEDIIKESEDLMQKEKIIARHDNHMHFVHNMAKTLLERNIESLDKLSRLSKMAADFKSLYNLTTTDAQELILLSSIHNIGKLGIDESILNKSGKLNSNEMREIKRHPDSGYRVASVINEFSNVANLILTHHERWNGKGYPQGLTGKEIPKLSRIFALMDSYDAMTHERPYRRAMSKTQAIDEIKKNSGILYDPEYTSIFIDYINSQN